MKSIFKLISLLTKKEQRRLIPLTLAVLLLSFTEIAGLGSLGPFIAAASTPQVIHAQPILSFFYEAGGFGKEQTFVVALGLIVVLIAILSTTFKIIVIYAIFRFVGNRRYSLGHRLFRRYLFQPYSYFLDHNTSELAKNLLTEVDQVINEVLRPAMDTFSRGIMALSIIGFLIFTNPIVALAAGGLFGILYGGIYSFVRPRLSRHGKTVREANRLRFKAVGEAFGAIKDVKILGKEEAFVDQYAVGARRFATTQAAKQMLSTIPSQILQPVAMGFIVVLVLAMIGMNGSLTEVLPLLAVYAVAVQKMIPDMQIFFKGIADMRYYGHLVDALYKDMHDMKIPAQADKNTMKTPLEKLPFNQRLEIRGLSFSYPTSRVPVLQAINFNIQKNTTIGLVGTTGCGKTTLVDVIMHLLEPTNGEILVDGNTISEIDKWQRNFGYVPQQIFLSDDTVAANIAFGIPENLRDMKAVEQAAKVANLHNFVTKEMPLGYDTIVGERGIRLSGGQRQRVGIARSLYHDPAILVMDEATSALDSVTEDAVMDAIHNLMHLKTIIIIAHRITTVQECDEIFMLEKGHIAAHGRYDELLRENSKFRAMAKIAENKS